MVGILENMSRKIPNAQEMGREGGKAVVEKYGSSYMSDLAKKGRESVKLNDPDYYKRLSQAGVAARMAKRKKAKANTAEKLSDLIFGK